MSLTAAPSPLSVLSEEEELFRQTVREFAETEIGPHVHEMDAEAKMRPDLLTKFFELGLMGIEVPEQSGGAGGSILLATVAIEEMARVDASSAIYVDVHNTLVNNALLRWGSDEQKARYLPRMTTDLLGAFALSEPASGSDAFALECKAVQDGAARVARDSSSRAPLWRTDRGRAAPRGRQPRDPAHCETLGVRLASVLIGPLARSGDDLSDPTS